MNKLIKSTTTLLFALAATFLYSCEDDGNVIGLNDATKYGSIKVTAEGTRPDGEAYKVTRDFRFASSTGPRYSSSVQTSYDGDIYRSFEVTRYAGPINEMGEGAGNAVWLDFGSQEDFDTKEIVNMYGGIYMEYPVTTSDKQFFYVYEYFEVDDENISNYKYNESTGKLSFKYVQELTGQESYS